MTRMMRLGLHLWQRMIDFSFVLLSFCCLTHLLYVLLNSLTNITLFTLILLRPLGGVIFIAVGFFITMFYPLSFCDKMGE
jgi:hypothetical protein